MMTGRVRCKTNQPASLSSSRRLDASPRAACSAPRLHHSSPAPTATRATFRKCPSFSFGARVFAVSTSASLIPASSPTVVTPNDANAATDAAPTPRNPPGSASPGSRLGCRAAAARPPSLAARSDAEGREASAASFAEPGALTRTRRRRTGDVDASTSTRVTVAEVPLLLFCGGSGGASRRRAGRGGSGCTIPRGAARAFDRRVAASDAGLSLFAAPEFRERRGRGARSRTGSRRRSRRATTAATARGARPTSSSAARPRDRARRSRSSCARTRRSATRRRTSWGVCITSPRWTASPRRT
mmetsp:Transcript_14423/g.51920  ORF Transcript_14423/g.51920 Transcript_14423/m.51920 type:complete len:300 (+) Transcript_14423:31-930(+)